MDVNVSYNTLKISARDICSVTVESDDYIYAYECRAITLGNPYGRGIGIDLVMDDVLTVNGVHELAGPVMSFNFDIDANELFSDGTYRVSIYVRDAEGIWWGDIP